MEAIMGKPPKPAPIIPPAPPPPSVDAAGERALGLDRTKYRRGAAATRLAPSSPGAGSAGRVGVYKALGGGV